MIKKMLGKLGVPITICFVIASVLGSAALLMMWFDASQDGNIHVTGVEQAEGIELWEGGTRLGLMHNLEIPIYYSDLTQGQNLSMRYDIKDLNTHTYYYYWNITSWPWESDPDSDLYGFRYGVFKYNGSPVPENLVDINHVKQTILPGTVTEQYVYYSLDPYFVSPPEGFNAPVFLTIEAWAE